MAKFGKRALLAVLLAGVGGPALAADLPVVEEPPPVIEEQPAPAPALGGWYLRGDLDYHWNDFRGADYYTHSYDAKKDRIIVNKDGHLDGDLDDSWSIGGGVGYQINDYLRTDVTLDWMGRADFEGSTKGFCGDKPCKSRDRTELEAWLLLANAYVDLGTYYGFTPYVGAGIGGAHVKWDELHNTIDDKTTKHEGENDWRFAWALMAGTSYCLTKNLDLDVGYRFARVEDGAMFGYKDNGGPGFDDGLNIHEVRAGLRYQFGGGRAACSEPEPIAYEPPPVEPVYK